MKRYHIKIYFPAEAREDLQDFTAYNNTRPWRYSAHCLDTIKDRAIDLRALLEFIKAQEMQAVSVFEFYADTAGIVKACYRVPWTSGLDVILVIGEGREIITVYLNTAEDGHATLDANLYAKA